MPQGDTPALDRCIRTLLAGVSARRAGETLGALRQLRDPALGEVFDAAAEGSNATLRVHGVLGLAELRSPPGLDLDRLTTIEDAREQAAILLHAAEHDLLSETVIAALLLADDLEPRIEVALRAQLVARGLDADRARLERLGAHPLPDVRFGALLLAGCIDPRGMGFDQLESALLDLEDEQRRGLTNYLLDFISTHGLEPVEPFLEFALFEFAEDPPRHAKILESLLERGAPGAESQWLDAYDLSLAAAERIGLAIAALNTAEVIGPAPFERMREAETELVVAIGRAGHGVAIGAAAHGDFVALVESGSPVVSGWAIEHADLLGAGARDFLLEPIRASASRLSTRAPVSREATLSCRRLAEIDVAALGEPLTDALERGDAGLARAIVLALLEAGAEPIWAIEPHPAWPTEQVGALGVLCRARSLVARGAVDALGASAAAALAGAGAGGSQLSEAHRVQAAWLALRASDQPIGSMLADRISRSSPPRPASRSLP